MGYEQTLRRAVRCGPAQRNIKKEKPLVEILIHLLGILKMINIIGLKLHGIIKQVFMDHLIVLLI